MSSLAPGRIPALSKVGLQLPIEPVPGAIDKAATRSGDAAQLKNCGKKWFVGDFPYGLWLTASGASRIRG